MTTKISTDNIQPNTVVSYAEFASSLVPKIITVNVANSTYAVLDDTAVNVGGGYLVITGSGFVSGSQVLIDVTPATSTTYINATTLRAQVPSKSAATYNLYVVNTDGGTATKVNGVTYSGIPTWVTGSTLANVISNTAFTGNVSATGATSYANTTALPTGFNLVTANGYYYGNISVGSATTYSFTVDAIDAENQESSRTFSLTTVVSNAPTTVEYLVVAGGGGGGGTGGGGGGAGGFRTSPSFSITPGASYTVTVGAGGNGNNGYPAGGVASSGSDSVFSTITSAGGGGGGSGQGNAYAGANGGSGGGSGGYDGNTQRSGGSGNTPSTSPSQGNNGGTNSSSPPNYGAGGGGGASAAGANGTSSNAGAGGAGTSSPLSGSSVTYAGGGAGGGENGTPSASGGSGGGGNTGQNGTANRGGGGGGSNVPNAGNNGGSGIVIIRYADTYDLASSTTGSPTVTTSGGYRIYQFTGSGSITW